MLKLGIVVLTLYSALAGSPVQSCDDMCVLSQIRGCESGHNYQAVSPSGVHRGAYQFDWPTWVAMGGEIDPKDASPEEQDYRAWLLYQEYGRTPWPHC